MADTPRRIWREWLFTCCRCGHAMVRYSCVTTKRPSLCYDCETREIANG